jgi:hypothetical protein
MTMPATKSSAKRPRKARNEGPSEIAPGVFVGGWSDALGFEGSRFCVLDEEPAEMPAAVHLAIYDEGSDRASRTRLDQLATSMAAARRKGGPILVFCGHGVRRSGLGGAWYLRRSEGISLDAAYERVRAVRPKVEHAREWVGNADELVSD